MSNNDDIDSFLENVDLVTSQINKILEGNADEATIKKYDEIISKKANEEKNKKIKEEMKVEESKRQAINGTKGKGEGKNYKLFCKFCFIEYDEDSIQQCTHCNRKLMTQKERHDELNIKVEQLKDKKIRKKTRKANFENWLKSEQIVKTRSFKNYQKWDLYESSSDEDEKGEPILPKNDPQFKAMEKDLNDRVKKQKEENNLAEKLKLQGNECVKNGQYTQAINKYTEAIDICKRMKVLYTNRALAYIKLEEYHLAFEDCEKVTEYYEVFEEELIDNLESYIKAMMRKIVCINNLKRFEESIEDLNKINQIRTNSNELTKDKISSTKLDKVFTNIVITEIENISKEATSQKIIYDKLKQEESNEGEDEATKVIKKEINDFITLIEDSLYNSTPLSFSNDWDKQIKKISICIKSNEKYAIFILKQNALEILYNLIASNPNEKSIEVLDLISSLIDNNIKKDNNSKMIVTINSFKFFSKLASLILIKDKDFLTLKRAEKIFSVLERASQEQSVRSKLISIQNIEQVISIIMNKYPFDDKNIVSCDILNVYMDMLTTVSNLLYSSPDDMKKRLWEIKNNIIDSYSLLISQVNTKFNNNTFDSQAVVSIKQVHLLESFTSLLTNMTIEESIRNYIKTQSEDLIKSLIGLISNDKFYDKETFLKVTNDLLERALSLLINLNINEDLTSLYITSNIESTVSSFYHILSTMNIEELTNPKKNLNTCIIRILTITQKIAKVKLTYLTSNSSKILIQVIRNFNFLSDILKSNPKNSSAQDLCSAAMKCLSVVFNRLTRNDLPFEYDIEPIKDYLSSFKSKIWKVIEIFDVEKGNDGKDNDVIVNSISLLISLFSMFTIYSLSEELFIEKDCDIKRIIDFCSNRLNLTRKNSAILLAKIAKVSEKQLAKVRSMHGMDILMNINSKLGIN